MFLVPLWISWWELWLLHRPVHIPGEPSPPSLLGPLLWALSLLKHQQGEKNLWYEKGQEALLATALPWTPPTVLAVFRWICEVSVNTLQASALLQSGTCTDLDCGLNTQYLILNTVWWLQWNKIILIKKKNLIHMCPQLLVPSLFPALTLVFCRVGMLTHGNVFPSTLQEMHHRSLWCCWRWWWWLEGWFFFFFNRKM